MTHDSVTIGSAGTGVPAGPSYPDIADTSRATTPAAAFFRSFFTAKAGKDIEGARAHFHPDKTLYFDATLGWGWPGNAELRTVWEQGMPGWAAEAMSYPTRILGDMTSAVVLTTSTPQLFGGEIRAIAIVDLQDGKIVRWVDYWDGRGFGAGHVSSMRVPGDSFPHDLGVAAVADRTGAIADAAHELTDALKAGDAARAGETFTYDATFEDMALRARLRGRAAITRYLQRALPDLPYAGAPIRHVVGNSLGGGYEWRADGQPVPRGATALELSDDGKIRKLTVVWDGSLLADEVMTEAAAHVIDR